MNDSQRMRGVQTPMIPVIGELIAQNPGTISLGQGVVHYGPPPRALEMLDRFMADRRNHQYQHVNGIPELTDAIAEKLESDNAMQLAGREVVVTAGSNMGFLNAVLAIADPGDEVVLLAPYYFNHEMAIGIASCRAVVVSCDDAFQPRVEAIEAAISDRTRAVVTVSPNNPTGVVYAPDALRAINALCAQRGIYHISDEAYEYFLYDGAEHYSPGCSPHSRGHTISLYSLSKAYGFASWRIGYMVVPDELVAAVKKIQDTNLICAPVISQYAALGALEMGAQYCRGFLQGMSEIRALVLEKLRSLGPRIEVPCSQGAFYFMVRVRSALDAMQLAERLICEHGVAVVPGTTFGLLDSCVVRIAYGELQKTTIEKGMGRFVSGVAALTQESPE